MDEVKASAKEAREVCSEVLEEIWCWGWEALNVEEKEVCFFYIEYHANSFVGAPIRKLESATKDTSKPAETRVDTVLSTSISFYSRTNKRHSNPV